MAKPQGYVYETAADLKQASPVGLGGVMGNNRTGRNQALSATGHDVQGPDTWCPARIGENIEFIGPDDGRSLALNVGTLLLTFVRPGIAHAS
jgi:hypothetical protein